MLGLILRKKGEGLGWPQYTLVNDRKWPDCTGAVGVAANEAHIPYESVNKFKATDVVSVEGSKYFGWLFVEVILQLLAETSQSTRCMLRQAVYEVGL